MTLRVRMVRWLLVASVGVLPAFILRCDRAALNFQRGLFQGLGEDAAEILLAQVAGDTQETE